VRELRRHLLLLTGICVPLYFFGLTTHGLMNTQEALRAMPAREMEARGDWLLPTKHGEPYIAKPPLIYWMQLALGALRPGPVGEFELRLTVAVAGLAGVIGTYLLARRLFHNPHDERFGPRAALWSALSLAVGVLYVRSSRIGEIDILLAPFTVATVGALHAVTQRLGSGGTVPWGMACAGALAAAGAGLSKGPPALGIVAIASLLPALIRALHTDGARRRGLLRGVGIGTAAIALGAAPLVLWLTAVRERIGSDRTAQLLQHQVEDNLRWFDPESPLNNLGFLAYGLLPMGAAAAACMVWVARERPRLSIGGITALTWLIAGYAMFSTMGKGVARYLTPLWPAMALLAGMWIATFLSDRRVGVRAKEKLRIAAVCAVCAAAAAQAWWYGDGRERFAAEQSPRAFFAALRAQVLPAAMGCLYFDTPLLDYYAGVPVKGYLRRGRTLEELARDVEASPGPFVLLMWEQTEQIVERHGSALDELAKAGLRFERVEIPAEARYHPREDAAPMTAGIVSRAAGGQTER